MNNVNLIGRLTEDPEVGYMANAQMTNTRFVAAVNRKLSKEKRQGTESSRYPIADFISCVAWGKTTENIGNYFHEGSRITTAGHIQARSYGNQQGQRIYTTDVVVDSFDFVESNSSSSTTNQGYSNPIDLGMNGQESSDSELPFQVM